MTTLQALSLLARNTLTYIPVVITFTDIVGTISVVQGESMQPTLNPEGYKLPDIIFLNKWSISDYNFQRGEIVVMKSPYRNSNIIKRIVGLEGDTITTKGPKPHKVVIPKGYCWIEGDNTRCSLDSNKYGPVALGLVVGRASAVIWPPSRWKKLYANLDN